jgi:glycosyltransferase involved in cell wall biosynthesis
MKPPEVVHIGPAKLALPALAGGAIERRMMALAAAQTRLYQRPIVTFSIGDETRVDSSGDVTIHYIRTLGPYLARAVRFAFAAVRHIRRWHPRIVHVHNRAEIAWLLKSVCSIPIVLSCDYPYEPFHRWKPLRGVSRRLYTRCLSSASVISPVSRYCMNEHCAYWGLPVQTSWILPNGVDLDHFHESGCLRATSRKNLGVENKLVWLYVGRICQQKGTDLLIEAYRRARHENPSIALVVAGPPESFGLTGSTRILDDLRAAGGQYLGAVQDADLPAIYNSCDVFVMPTRDLEMFGMAAVEAQACGKPVIASDHGGLRETVPETAGIRFRAGDVVDLTAKLTNLSRNFRLRQQLSHGALNNAERYSWATIALRAEELYREAFCLEQAKTKKRSLTTIRAPYHRNG